MNRTWFSRIAYLISRTIMRPERAVSTVSHYYPVLDVISLLLLLGLWIAGLRGLTQLRELLHGMLPPVELTGRIFSAMFAFGVSLVIVAIYAFSVSIAAGLLGGKPRLMATFLAFLLTAAVALGLSAVPATILRMVEVGEEMGVVSAAIIEVGPWIYIMILFYSATLRIHKTVPGRAIVYLGLGLLPILLGFTLLWRFLDLRLPIGLV